MQIDKLFDEFCSLIQEQKKIFNEMNQCATQIFDVRHYFELIDKYNATIKKCAEVHKRLITMQDKNIESMQLSLKQYYRIKE